MSFMSNAVTTGMAAESDTYWRNLEQGFIDDAWENTTQVHTIKEQEDVGSDTYNDVEVWTATTLQISGTNYYKDANQGMQFLFRDIGKLHEPGIYYQWEKSDAQGHTYYTWWLSYYVHSDVNYQSYSIAVRCDNILKYKNPDTGVIEKWPCRIGNEATATNEQVTNYIVTPHNKLNVVVQRNAKTEKYFRVNRRFLIGGGGANDNMRPFKIIALQNAHKLISLHDSASGEETANILYLTLEMDEVNPKDDFVNGVAFNADAEEYVAPETDIVITPAFNKIKIDHEVVFQIYKEGATSYECYPSVGDTDKMTITAVNETGKYKIVGTKIGNCKFNCVAHTDESTYNKEYSIRIVSLIG